MIKEYPKPHKHTNYKNIWPNGLLVNICHILAGCAALLFLNSSAGAADVIIVGDSQYAVVADVISGIRDLLRVQNKEYATADVRGRLAAVVAREDAQVVVALGMDVLSEALRLPPDVNVVYGLVAVPPKSGRVNQTGVFMSPPVNEYVTLVRRHLPGLNKISVVGSPDMLKSLLGAESAHVGVYPVTNSSELVSAVNRLANTRALVLLPDATLLTSQVMSSLYLFSFRSNIPLLGISEANVKQGSLFALVFDAKTVSRQIGEKVQALLDGANATELPASPPRKFNLFINDNTARKMGIDIPEEMMKKAKKIY